MTGYAAVLVASVGSAQPCDPGIASRVAIENAEASGMAASDGLVYSAFLRDAGGLYIFDTADPAAPQLVGSLIDTERSAGGLIDVAVDGTTVYAAALDRLVVIDASDPASPVEIASIPLPGTAFGVDVRDGLLGVAVFNPNGGIVLADVTDPADPEVLPFIVTPGSHSVSFGEDVAVYSVNGATAGIGLGVIDLTDVDAPEVVGTVPSGSPMPLNNPNDIVLRGPLAIIANGGGISVFDVSSPGDIEELAAEQLLPTGSEAIAVDGDLLFLSAVSSGVGIHAVDISSPTEPTVVGSAPAFEAVAPIATEGGLVFAADWGTGELVVVNFRDCRPRCRADVNGNGAVDSSDFFAWVNAFGSDGPLCDQNADGRCTQSDFFAWVANFGAPCPN
ncbi:MAG: GC-type dockerin domain-anchored protein [Planctomycetota bacterium]